jgi:hypothetical protein
MASEDSVEHCVHWPPALLPVLVHRIRDFHDGRKAGWASMQTQPKKMHRIFKELDVCTTCREAHIAPRERQEMLRDRRPRTDREHEHGGVAWLWPDPSAPERLLSHLEELSPSPVLIHEKLRLDVVAQEVRAMPLHRDAPTALSLHDTGDEPASCLCTRQSFLLIVRTRHVVTVPPTWDGTRSAGCTDVPAYS